MTSRPSYLVLTNNVISLLYKMGIEFPLVWEEQHGRHENNLKFKLRKPVDSLKQTALQSIKCVNKDI